jgi:hypothetical protein
LGERRRSSCDRVGHDKALPRPSDSVI